MEKGRERALPRRSQAAGSRCEWRRWSASFNCRRDDEVGDAGGGGAGGKGEGGVEDDEGRLGARGNGLGGAVGGADGDSLHGGPGTHKSLLRHVSEPTNHFFVLITADAIANTYGKGVPISSQVLFEPMFSPSAPDLRIALEDLSITLRFKIILGLLSAQSSTYGRIPMVTSEMVDISANLA